MAARSLQTVVTGVVGVGLFTFGVHPINADPPTTSTIPVTQVAVQLPAMNLTALSKALAPARGEQVQVILEVPLNSGDVLTVGVNTTIGPRLPADVMTQARTVMNGTVPQQALSADLPVARRIVIPESRKALLQDVSRDPVTQPMETAPETLAAPAAADLAQCVAKPFLPAARGVTLDFLERGDRRLTASFEWPQGVGNLMRLKACRGDTGTYEHEVWLNNYDGLHIMSPNAVQSWSSNMPSAYLDTPASDSGGELSFTVGTYQTQELKIDKKYSWTIIARGGNTDKDTAKITGQRGRRSPSWCYSEWCVFSDATQFIVNAWNKKLGRWPV